MHTAYIQSEGIVEGVANQKGNMLARRQKGGKICRMEMNQKGSAQRYGRKPQNGWLYNKQLEKQEAVENDCI